MMTRHTKMIKAMSAGRSKIGMVAVRGACTATGVYVSKGCGYNDKIMRKYEENVRRCSRKHRDST